METKYYHDEKNKAVYEMELPPHVIEKKDKKGRLTGWLVSAEITITRSDNIWLPEKWQWKYDAHKHPSQTFDLRDNKDSAIRYFMVHHEPNFPEIDAETYNKLQAEYKAESLKNKA